MSDHAVESTEYAVFTLTDIDGMDLPPAIGSITLHVRDGEPDEDTDGLADTWEQAHFGDLSAGALDDPDHDGWNNLQEMSRGGDPRRAMVRDDDRQLDLEMATPRVGDVQPTVDSMPSDFKMDPTRTVSLGAVHFEYKADGHLNRIVEPGPLVRTYSKQTQGARVTCSVQGARPGPCDRGTPMAVQQQIDHFNQVVARLASPVQYITGHALADTNLVITINDVRCTRQPGGNFIAAVPFNNLQRFLDAEVVIRAVRPSDERVAEVRGIVAIEAALQRFDNRATGHRSGATALDARNRPWAE